MRQIPTAGEFLTEKGYPGFAKHTLIKEWMKEFAKMHVTAALKEALESIPCLGSSTDIATYEEVEEAVLNSYPLEDIK